MLTVSSTNSSTAITQNSQNNSSTSKTDKMIQNLMKQKSRISEEIQSVRVNEKLDTKIKNQRIQTLTSSMQEIDAQIAQIKAEEMQEKTRQKEAERAPQPEQPQEQQQDVHSLDSVIKNSNTYEHLGKMVSLRKNLKGNITNLEGGVRFDRIIMENDPTGDGGKSQMIENAERTVFKMKREMVQDIKSQIIKTDMKIGELLKDIHDTAPSDNNPTKIANADKSETDDDTDNKKAANNAKSSDTAIDNTAPVQAERTPIDIRV